MIHNHIWSRNFRIYYGDISHTLCIFYLVNKETFMQSYVFAKFSETFLIFQKVFCTGIWHFRNISCTRQSWACDKFLHHDKRQCDNVLYLGFCNAKIRKMFASWSQKHWLFWLKTVPEMSRKVVACARLWKMYILKTYKVLKNVISWA